MKKINKKEQEQKNMIIGYRLKQLRLRSGYTQNLIAEVLGVSPQHYGTIERGLNSCSLDIIIILCNLYKVPITNIVGNLTIVDSNSINASEKLGYMINDLSPDHRDTVIHLINYLKSKEKVKKRKKDTLLEE